MERKFRPPLTRKIVSESSETVAVIHYKPPIDQATQMERQANVKDEKKESALRMAGGKKLT